MKKILLIIFFILNFEIAKAENKIAYININHILNNSIVGQSITEHIKKIKEKKISEFKSIEKQLSTKEQSLIKEKNILSTEEFEKQVSKLNEEIKLYRKNKNVFNKNMEKKKLEYTKIVLNSLNPIISKYVEENSIMVVFPKKNIIIAKKNLDITTQIMGLLNDQLNKIDF